MKKLKYNKDRRRFLKQAGLTSGMSFLLNSGSVHSSSLSYLNSLVDLGGEEDRILLLVRLAGGNDGLNTVVPRDQLGQYRNLRPTLGWSSSELISLTDQIAIPKVMQSLQQMWDGGSLRIIQGVGYKDQSLSHFRSTDIWSSGIAAEDELDSGWLGRMLEADYPNFITELPDVPPSIQFSGVANRTTFNTDLINIGSVFRSADELNRIVQLGKLYDVVNLPDCTYGEQLGFIRAIYNAAGEYAKLISNVFQASSNSKTDYYDEIGKQLSAVARLIRGNLGTRIYMVTLDGFDTHSSQNSRHPRLIESLADNIKTFYDDLREAGLAQNVLGITFSEFGRRIEENQSAGTDHGAASPMMLFGDALNGSGVFGEHPDLNDLDRSGNLNFNIDFKSVYSTILEDWFCLSPDRVNHIMGQDYERIDLGFECTTSSLFKNDRYSMPLEFRYHQHGQVDVWFEMDQSGDVEIDLLTINGMSLENVHSGYLRSGAHQKPLASTLHLPQGPYICRIRQGEKAISRQFVLMQSR